MNPHRRRSVDPFAVVLIGSGLLTVVFTDTSTTTHGTLNAWLWDFGDGTTSPITNPVHIYTATPSATLRGQAGVYTVSLTATGATQDTLTRTAYINVNDGLSQETVIRYTYDPLSRLTGATYSGAYTYTFGYGYDEVGNRTAMTKTITSTLVTTYTYDAANRLAVISG
ncbi:MAG TPA: PKD domain-containing protein, partial [Anaerolineae bacterium]|nr:PKD domain-containing protein [Anaerolineae bacterium]